MRINTSIRSFYENLETYANIERWPFKPYTTTVKDQYEDTIYYTNNLVAFEEIGKYNSGKPEEFKVTYFLPSYVAAPTSDTPHFEGVQMPVVEWHHQITFVIKEAYPEQVGKTRIDALTRLWHTNFRGGDYYDHTRNNSQKPQKAHACVLISGEIDSMAMNIFQQLLWHPEFCWNSRHGENFTINSRAFDFAKTNGKQLPYEYLKELLVTH